MATGVLMITGSWIADTARMAIALVLAAVMTAPANWASDRFVLVMHDVPEADERSAHGLMDLVTSFAQQAARSISRIFIIHDDRLNVFATGRGLKHPAVLVSTGPLGELPTAELAGVPAHESTHFQRHGLPTPIIAATFSNEINILTNIGFSFGSRRHSESDNTLGTLRRFLPPFLTPATAIMVHLANSRTRNFAVAKRAPQIPHHRVAFTGAFSGIAAIAQNAPNINAERAPATAQVFVINLLSSQQLEHLFAILVSSHIRVARLGQHGWRAFNASWRQNPRRDHALKLPQAKKTEERSLSSAIPP